MSSSIEQLQTEAVDPSIAVSTLLQKAVLLAHKLRDAGFAQWAKLELNGYKGNDSQAPYRNLNGRYVVITVDRGTLAIPWEDPSKMKERFITLPLREVESLIAGKGGLA